MALDANASAPLFSPALCKQIHFNAVADPQKRLRANKCVNAAGGTRLNKTADNGGHISVPAVPVGLGSRGLTWPVTCDTQYGSPRLIDATLSTLITETAAMSKAAN